MSEVPEASCVCTYVGKASIIKHNQDFPFKILEPEMKIML